MIPRTYPSEYVTANGKTQMLVYVLTNITGLTRWIDYIPVKGVASENTVVENTYNYNGYMLMKTKDSITGLTPFKEYVPVYEDAAATVPWGTGSNGYIPAYGLFTVQGLFANGEQGWVYDPSNLSTLFQDAAGTTPVTAMEQPVGLQLDTRLGAPTTLGAELVTNGDFSNGSTGWAYDAGWSFSGGSAVGNIVTGNGYLYQPGKLTVGKFYSFTFTVVSITSGSIRPIANSTIGTNVTSAGTYTQILLCSGGTSITLQGVGGFSGTIDNISVRELPGNHRYQTTSANRPVVSARVNLLTATETLSTQTVTTRATAQTLTFTGAGSITLSGTATGTYTAGTYSITTTAGSLTLTVSGTVTQADLRATNMGVGLPSYQRVNTSTDYDTAGFPVYIKANGSNQFMVSNAIDFTATDKMTVWAGVRKFSDPASGQLAMELSASSTDNSGTFFIAPTFPSTTQYGFRNGGTIRQTTVSGNLIAPLTHIVTAIGDISGDSAILRINGAQVAQSTSDQGAGNYGNYGAYHYSRAGALLFFNGHDYGSICRGAASSAAQITAAEGWINQRTKAY